MFNLISTPSIDSCNCLTVKLLDELEDAVLHVKKSRRWHLVDPLTKAFIKAFNIRDRRC